MHGYLRRGEEGERSPQRGIRPDSEMGSGVNIR